MFKKNCDKQSKEKKNSKQLKNQNEPSYQGYRKFMYITVKKSTGKYL